MTLPGVSASTASAIATAAGRSVPSWKSTVAFSARIAGIGRIEGIGQAGMDLGGVEILDLEREVGQLAVALGELRLQLDQAGVLGERLAGIAAVAQELGIMQPRRRMVLVQPEDVAELDLRPRRDRPASRKARPRW